MTVIIKFVLCIATISIFPVKTAGQYCENAYTTSCPLPLPRDCRDKAQNGCNKDGIYAIDPGNGKPMYVYCKGWSIVVLRQKLGGSENFNRSWEDYVNGFGDLEGEFWIGLKTIRLLASDSVKIKSLKVGIFTGSGYKRVQYNSFFVDSSEKNYTLKIGVYYNSREQNIKNYLNLQSGMQFSTYDRDNDQEKSVNCALRHGAWWYNTCASLNDNIQYLGEQLQATSGSTSLRVADIMID